MPLHKSPMRGSEMAAECSLLQLLCIQCLLAARYLARDSGARKTDNPFFSQRISGTYATVWESHMINMKRMLTGDKPEEGSAELHSNMPPRGGLPSASH